MTVNEMARVFLVLWILKGTGVHGIVPPPGGAIVKFADEGPGIVIDQLLPVLPNVIITADDGVTALDPGSMVSFSYHPGFLIVNPAIVEHKSKKDLHIYAIGEPVLRNYNGEDVLEEAPIDRAVYKNGYMLKRGEALMLPTAYDATPRDQGLYWLMKSRVRGPDVRIGSYELANEFNEQLLTEDQMPTAFVGASSKHLDARGVHTYTVYRESVGSNLLDRPLNFGVRLTSRSCKLRWSKDGRRLPRKAARMTVRSVEDAGLYTLHLDTRKKRGWFVQIRISVSQCPRDVLNVFPGPEPTCGNAILPCFCLNGGVCFHVFSGVCQCPSCFRGIYCEHFALTDDQYAIRESRDFTCGDLPGGNPTCKEYKFCFGGNYGCSCGCGWHGPNCDKPCRKGRYGADCLQKCNCPGNTCDPVTGVCEEPDCPEGFRGFNCQIPDGIPFSDGLASI